MLSVSRLKLLIGGFILIIAVAVVVWLWLPLPSTPAEPVRVAPDQPDMAWLERLYASSWSRDWPQWRGANRDGVSGESLSDDPWPTGAPKKLWSVPGGPGTAGVSVVGDRAYTVVQQGDSEVLLCLSVLTGEPRWRQSVAARFQEPNAGVGPHASPTVADGQVYTVGATGQLLCCDAITGAILWRHDLPQELGGGVPTYGASCAPLAVGDLVVVQPGGPFLGGPVAYDRRDGHLVWRSSTASGSYSSPIVATLAGRRQIVAATGDRITGVAVEDGHVLWSHNWKTDYNIATPIVRGDCVFYSSGYGMGCVLLLLQPGAGGTLTPSVFYQNTRMKNHFASCVLVQQRVYGFDDDLLTCMDFATGEVRWRQRGFGKGSLVALDDRLLVLGDDGRLAIVDAGTDDYRERASCKVSSTKCWTVPTVSQGRIFIRDLETIACYELDANATAKRIPRKTPWLTSAVQGSPDPPPPYRSSLAFPNLRLKLPTDLVAVPGTKRLAVSELRGAIRIFERDSDVDHADVLVDLGSLVLGLAFHPQFAKNGRVYVFHAAGDFMQVSRFVVKRDGAWSIDPASGSTVLRWPYKGELTHLGGGLRFGPDGFLYIGIGDGSDGMDGDATGQNIGDLGASILRVDISQEPYAVPPDNPFVGRKDARPEIWAYGIRQPWKMSFDGADLWVGDVGQELWESVLRVRRGGNYGWSVMEGGHPFLKDRPVGPTPIEPPILSHPHTELRSVIGGAVYRGTRLPELAGSYVYGDYITGRVMEARMDGDRLVRQRELAATSLQMVAICGETGDELYFLNHGDGTIHTLVPNTGAAHNPKFPKTLTETGLFESVRELRPAAGVVPYEVNAALWSDGAAKDRLIALPGSSQIGFDGDRNRTVRPFTLIWEFPTGTVLVKTFSLGGRRVETRLLTLQSPDGVGEPAWRGYSYRWRADQADADLVDAAGQDLALERQSWHFPSRTECRMCHTQSAAYVLGVTTPQMNREVAVPGRGRMSQLRHLEQLGLFEGPLPSSPSILPRWVDWMDETQDLELRARSYLHANCAHCHIFRGGGNASFQLQGNLSLPQTGIVDLPPAHGGFGLKDARVLAPGAPERSVLLHRMGLSGPGRMPPTSTSVVDEAGTKLLGEWIRRLTK